MIPPIDEARLLGAIGRARCVLFLGAGFSSDALDGTGRTLPGSYQLAEELWAWSGLQSKHGAYAGQELQRIFQIVLTQKGERALSEFLRDRLIAKSIPNWYDLISRPFWYRIYSTYVDNVVEEVYRRSGGGQLDVVDGLHERPRDRDQFLERIQYVKLNGDVRGGAGKVTFGTRAYARRAVEVDPWWDQFVRDYVQNLTVFIGTSLNEPLLSQALEARGARGAAVIEGRLGSFLISKPLDPTILLSLPEFNVSGIESVAKDFVTYLDAALGPPRDRLEVLMDSAPSLAVYVQSLRKDPRIGVAAAAFLTVFEEVRLPDAPRNYSSLFHQGADPTWLDIAAGLDAPREVSQGLIRDIGERLSEKGEQPAIVLSGNRGSGKSTVLMRVAAQLAAEGLPTYFSRGERLESIDGALPFLSQFPKRVVLVIDNADAAGMRGLELVESLRRLTTPPLILLGVRSPMLFYLEELEHKDIAIGDLSDRDIEGLIDTLEKHGSLGLLTDAGRERIRREFAIRANKVLLVALKEATLSEGFREIILREFREIEVEEFRILYLCAALVSAEDTSLTKGQLIDCATSTPAEALSALSRELRGLVVRSGEAGDRVTTRHSLIALEVVNSIAPRGLLALAYKRLLSTLASDMDSRARIGEPARSFRLYKRLVNHKVIYERFDRDLDEARGIFQAIEMRLSLDPHYWLQFGSLELQYGELAWAERHLATALGLSPNDFLVRNTWAHLKFSQAVAAPDYEGAVQLRKEASELLSELIAERGGESSHPWHIMLSQSLKWLSVWEDDDERRLKDLTELRTLADEACAARPRSHELRAAKQEVLREYLRLAETKD